jgi:hypothetical protein
MFRFADAGRKSGLQLTVAAAYIATKETFEIYQHSKVIHPMANSTDVCFKLSGFAMEVLSLISTSRIDFECFIEPSHHILSFCLQRTMNETVCF